MEKEEAGFMKRMFCFIFILIFTFLPLALSAQSEDTVYAKSFPIIKVLAHKLGYKVYYLKQDMDLAYIYVPMTWISQVGGKGEIIWGYSTAYPYMSVIWKNGEFYQIKLYLISDFNDISWGRLDATIEDMREKFDIAEPALEF
jgi:hypothetical protein